MFLHKDIVSGIVILILCAIGAASVGELPATTAPEVVGPATLPKLCLYVLAFLACILIIRGIRFCHIQEGAKFNFCWKSILFYGFYLLYLFAMVAIGDIVASNYIETIPYAGGFVISTIFFLILSFLFLRRRKMVEIISVAVITTLVLAVSFGGFFKVLLP